jgi:hypothetical protein
VPKTTIQLNFRAMSQKQVDAMGALTLGNPAIAAASPIFPQSPVDIPEMPDPFGDPDRLAQEERERRAQETLQSWRDNSDEILYGGGSTAFDPPYDDSRNYDPPSSYDSGGYDSGPGPSDW